MSIATQTFGLPARQNLRQNVRHGGTFTAIGARVWLRLIESIKARMAAAAEARAQRELLALADFYQDSMPTFAAELRAANCRR